ncbi:MAG: hypothetical protein D6E12_13295 [Desulfovibrio sp.]|nr:MAG: hypothetical protein D6E12_13295 [Desulfovibrio sp.]
MTLNKSIVARSLALGVLGVLVLVSLGCGRKSWPEAQILAEEFGYKTIHAVREEGCLVIRTALDGKWQNMSRMLLEISDTDTDCPGCPFYPSQEVEVSTEAGNLMQEEEVLIIRLCGLNEGQTYRWRLVAYNVYDELGPVISEVRLTAP